ncbi:hypothetical protein CONCODRAFT_12199 [Conidiobolus coronatus NRRL 28638]|uniref:Uncharacterized protein n=1 Tax=Conidiobolus coronatus (strain ATCC 28846 / CBS 209.66 / NRRL 28638) TaxID=796925 RepID=A0A137NTI5_CONC2|nr:hypothetical protein CONCODRAFT_12199 [Conidiobolus coronatus NRRL 28638]|eukprot:KXN66049.1 hypothetical protein CONCODRAFT_12199 [Conidiobolus coronatus NRRL 28638]
MNFIFLALSTLSALQVTFTTSDNPTALTLDIEESTCLPLDPEWKELDMKKGVQVILSTKPNCKGKSKSRMVYSGMLDLSKLNENGEFGYFKLVKNIFVHNEGGKGKYNLAGGALL